MALLYLLELIFFLALILFIMTQVIIPICLGIPKFPLVRRQGELEEELTDAQGDLEEVLLEEKIRKVKEGTLRLKKTEKTEKSNEKEGSDVR